MRLQGGQQSPKLPKPKYKRVPPEALSAYSILPIQTQTPKQTLNSLRDLDIKSSVSEPAVYSTIVWGHEGASAPDISRLGINPLLWSSGSSGQALSEHASHQVG